MPIKTIKDRIVLINKPNNWRNNSRHIIINGEVKKFGKAFRVNFVTLMISSLGLLVALTWNNLWNTWVIKLSLEDNITYKSYLAVGVTILAVVLTYVLSRVKGE